MDPTEAFRDFVNLVCENKIYSAESKLSAIARWINQGGFEPDFPNGKIPVAFVENLHTLLSQAIETREQKNE